MILDKQMGGVNQRGREEKKPAEDFCAVEVNSPIFQGDTENHI